MNKVFGSLQVKKQGNNTSSPNFAALLSLLSGVCQFLFVALWLWEFVFLERDYLFLLVSFSWVFHCWVLMLYAVCELTGGFLTLPCLWNSQISHPFNVSDLFNC